MEVKTAAKSQERRAKSQKLSSQLLAIGFSLLAFSCRFAFAENSQDFYKSGNQFYASGKFTEAAQAYQSAIDSGLRSWVLEFNIGNAYYREGAIGKAALHFERAFHLNSSDPDVIYNLNLVTVKAGDPELPSSALPKLAWRLFYIFGINALTVIWMLFFFVCVAAAGAALYVKPIFSRDRVVGIAFIFFILSGWLGVRIYLLEKSEGVVVGQMAEVRSGPNTSYAANFTVPEGHRVMILKDQEPIQGWLEIGVPEQGLKGWVPDASVEVI